MSLFGRTTWREETNEELRGPVDNPWRGLYQLAKYTVSDHADASDNAIFSALDPYKPDTRLVLTDINLMEYRRGEISPEGLDYISAIFDAYRRRKKQLIVRFLYDWDGNGLLNEPGRASDVMRHMEQAGAVMRGSADMILTHQGIFVGSWGEMHGSKFLSGRWIRELTEKLLSATDHRIPVSVRTPACWRLLTGRALPAPDMRELGLYNDGMFGSETDLGTYGAPASADAEDGAPRLSREEETAFLNALGRLAPIGGEAVRGTQEISFGQTCAELAKTRVTYLNRDYDARIYAEWKKEQIGQDNGFSYIADRLGYRYTLRGAALRRGVLTARVENTGFAPIYRPLRTEFILEGGGRTRALAAQADPRTWVGGETAEVKLPLEAAEAGVWTVSLRLTDGGLGEEVAFANAKGGLLGTLTVR